MPAGRSPGCSLDVLRQRVAHVVRQVGERGRAQPGRPAGTSEAVSIPHRVGGDQVRDPPPGTGDLGPSAARPSVGGPARASRAGVRVRLSTRLTAMLTAMAGPVVVKTRSANTMHRVASTTGDGRPGDHPAHAGRRERRARAVAPRRDGAARGTARPGRRQSVPAPARSRSGRSRWKVETANRSFMPHHATTTAPMPRPRLTTPKARRSAGTATAR